MKKEQEITVLVVEPDKKPYAKTIKNRLEEMQEIVGGYIETLPLEEGIDIVCNEEGKINGLELNRPLYHEGKMYEIIAGTFFIAGADLESGEFISLNREAIDKYAEQFLRPVLFMKINNEIVAIPRDELYISANEFGKYLAVQRSGVTNMFDLKVVEQLTGLSRDKITFIMKHYGELEEIYCE